MKNSAAGTFTDRSTERGTTLVFTLMILFAVLTLTLAGLIASRSDSKISSNYQTGAQALLNAQSGILHSKETIDAFGAVVALDQDVVARWDTIFGSSSISVAGHPQLRYSVTASTDPTNPRGRMVLTASGRAPNEAQRVIRAGLALDGAYSPGAIYLPGDTVNPNFNGNRFLVDGNDTNLDGTPHPSGTVPGISGRDPDVADAVLDALSTGQDDNVVGAGGIPSVRQSSGFTTADLLNDIIPAILAYPNVVTDPQLNGNDVFGTLLVPQVTYFTGSVNVTGNLTGTGILIVEEGLTISGSSDFTGLIIVKGTTQITTVQGNTTILGALWTTDLRLVVGGSASVTYSSQALQLVNAMFTSPPLPQRVKVASWKES
ncbi:MAG: pilus assembly PilX N-terminal domain-containing protein [Candidatus Binatia bacterium]